MKLGNFVRPSRRSARSPRRRGSPSSARSCRRAPTGSPPARSPSCDPRGNFAISQRGRTTGVDHLGIQVEEGAELAEVAARLNSAGESIFEQKGAACCYARSDKAWVKDPQGVAWETFHTFGEETQYGQDAAPVPEEAESCATSKTCCAPAADAR
ncbi:MAG: hypothetical protein AB1689_27170 [Thermodesulfobacteriota bacterium]